MRYALTEVEFTDPDAKVRVSNEESGVGILVRYEDAPVGFILLDREPGCLEGQELRDLLTDRAGDEIAAELLERELRAEGTLPGLPPLTVAVCTRNHPDYVSRVIRSLTMAAHSSLCLTQLEILIVDNAPSDESTRMVVESFSDVRYAREPKPGLDFGRNRALREARGEILAFIDDDATVDRWWFRGLARAYADNPDAAAFTGPVLPWELTTPAQILFEQRGGFGRKFMRRRFGPDSASIRNYPCNAGVFGAGCNMAFRRESLIRLGGFDEALDTGAPLPGGGDLDIFYRVLRAGLPLIYEPRQLIYHQHRREYRALRRQMYTWGLGIMTYAVRNYRYDPAHRLRFRCMMLGWFRTLSVMALRSFRRGNVWKPDLAFAELWGGIVGLCGGYGRSVRRVDRIRKRYAS